MLGSGVSLPFRSSQCAGARQRYTMKAMTQDVYGSANVLVLNDIDMPVVGGDEVLLRVHAAGVGPDGRRVAQTQDPCLIANDNPYRRNLATCLCKSCRVPDPNYLGSRSLQPYICTLHSYCAWRCPSNSR